MKVIDIAQSGLPAARARSWMPGALAGLVLFWAAGCAIPTRVAELNMEIPRNATSVAIHSGIDTMDDPATQARVAQMLSRPEMRQIQREMVAGMIDGTLATLEDGGRVRRFDAVAARAVKGMLGGAAEDLGPIAKDVTRGAVDGALEAALDPGRREALESSVETVVATGVRSAAQGVKDAGLGKTIAAAMTDDIGPALRTSARDSVAPGLAEMLKNEELRRELGATARVLGREMVAGATEALAEKKDPAGDGSLLSRLSGLAESGARLFGSAAWVLLLVIVGLLVWIVRLSVQVRRAASAPAGAEKRGVRRRIRGRLRGAARPVRADSHARERPGAPARVSEPALPRRGSTASAGTSGASTKRNTARRGEAA